MSEKVTCALCGRTAKTSKMKISFGIRPGQFICKDEMACLARQRKS